ncbi:MAG: imidazole glycerol phosphate synthase subunit HisF [Cyanobacteria bacterium SZAS LIN-2]|nr:imidazole glycerol phosphate synthase subunit HisF [Cyanobacteria bacterium SZAS LIN-2]
MSPSGLCKRIIPCLDVSGGRTVKGLKFQNLRDVGDPVELGIAYQEQGADELMFLDISATHEERATVFDLVKNVALHLSIPFTVGGGISSLDDVRKLLDCGADKVSINSAAVKRPELVGEIASHCGSQCCVVAIDAKMLTPGKWQVMVRGGREATGIDALAWAKECYERGAGEILLTSFDADGTQAGFDLPMVDAFANALPIPVIASGGARDPQSFVDVFNLAAADAALAASIFHDNLYTISDVKNTLSQAGIQVRIC